MARVEEPSFEIDVTCAAGDTLHNHRLRLAPTKRRGRAGWGRGPAVVGQRPIEFTCPSTGKSYITRITPPPDVDPPFRVVSIE